MWDAKFMIDNVKHAEDRHSTIVSAPASATQVTDSNFQAFSAAHVLPNGTSILIRAVRPDDKERLRAASDELERASIYTRFFGYKKALTEAELEQATNVDFDRVVALWATIGSGDAEIIIGGGRYVRNTESAARLGAEVAFAVALPRTRNCKLPLGSPGPYRPQQRCRAVRR